MEACKSNWIEIRRAAGKGVAVIPLGSFEAHGPHLPCGTDSLLVEAMVNRAALASGPARVVVFPTVHYNVVEWARPFASVGLLGTTLITSLIDVARDIHALGFRKFVFVNGHGNMPAAQMAIWQLRQEGKHALYVDCCPYFMAGNKTEMLAGGESLGHAGLVETALLLAIQPELVDMSEAVDGPTDLWGEDFPFKSLRGRPGVFAIPSVEALNASVEGCATRATPALGKKLLDLYVGVLAELLDDLAGKDVPAVFLKPTVQPLPRAKVKGSSQRH